MLRLTNILFSTMWCETMKHLFGLICGLIVLTIRFILHGKLVGKCLYYSCCLSNLMISNEKTWATATMYHTIDPIAAITINVDSLTYLRLFFVWLYDRSMDFSASYAILSDSFKCRLFTCFYLATISFFACNWAFSFVL